MSNDRKEKLKKIIKEAELDKTAQDAITNAGESKGEEFAHKIFEALIDNLKIDGLDE
jgi:hypothetical protein